MGNHHLPKKEQANDSPVSFSYRNVTDKKRSDISSTLLTFSKIIEQFSR